VATQTLRGEGYYDYTTTLAAMPFMVGFHWFEYTDQPAEGRFPDGENSNYGVVTIGGTRTSATASVVSIETCGSHLAWFYCTVRTDAVYTALTQKMTPTNQLLPALHSSTPFTTSAMCVSQLTCLNGCSGHGCCDTDTGVCVCDSGFSLADCSEDNCTHVVSCRLLFTLAHLIACVLHA
jgi:hypothetical protein